MSEPAYVCMECARTTSGRCVQHSYVPMPKQDILSECIALRKRVEELEEHRKELIELVDSRTRGWREAAENAERERDSYRRDFDAAANAIDRLQADLDDMRRQRDELQAYVNEDLIPTQVRARGLQADLDAALTCLLAWEPSVLSWCQRHPQPAQPEAVAAYERIKALLEKRREENRG